MYAEARVDDKFSGSAIPKIEAVFSKCSVNVKVENEKQHNEKLGSDTDLPKNHSIVNHVRRKKIENIEKTLPPCLFKRLRSGQKQNPNDTSCKSMESLCSEKDSTFTTDCKRNFSNDINRTKDLCGNVKVQIDSSGQNNVTIPDVEIIDNKDDKTSSLNTNSLNSIEVEKTVQKDFMNVSYKGNERKLDEELDAKTKIESENGNRYLINPIVKPNFMGDAKLINDILVQSCIPIHPGATLEALGLDDKVYKILKRDINDIRTCHMYGIPTILTRHDTVLVGSPKSGKTFTYVVAIISLLRDQLYYKQLKRGIGSRVIILCPYSFQCKQVYNMCKQIIQSISDLSVFLAYGCGTESEINMLMELTKGYDILVTTPNWLKRMLQHKDMFNLKRLTHIILDNASIMFKYFLPQICEIISLAYKAVKIRGAVSLQTIIVSDRWFTELKQLMKDILKDPVLLVESYTEAAILSKIQCSLHVTSPDEKIKVVRDVLQGSAFGKRVVIVCDRSEEANALYENLTPTSRKTLLITENISHTLHDDLIADWHSHASLAHSSPVLLCTDSVLLDTKVHNAQYLIHYNLPGAKSQFCSRFELLLDSYQNFHNNNKQDSTSETVILMDEDNDRQCLEIVKLVERFGAKIPEKLSHLVKERHTIKEHEKRDRSLCCYMKQFGQCSNIKNCRDRHVILKNETSPQYIPKEESIVKLKVTHVHSANHLSGRLVAQYVHNEWKPFAVQGLSLSFKISMYFSNADNREKEHNNAAIGDIAAIQQKENNLFQRVKIIELFQKQNNSQYATVKFIDDGKVEDVSLCKLIWLPEYIRNMNPQTVDFFICGILPTDNDISWNDIVTSHVRDEMSRLSSFEKSGAYYMGKIKLSLGHDLWLESLECRQWLPETKICATHFSLKQYLLKNGLAVLSNNHLPSLLSLLPVDENSETAATNNVNSVTENELVENLEPEKEPVNYHKKSENTLSGEPKKMSVNQIPTSYENHESSNYKKPNSDLLVDDSDDDNDECQNDTISMNNDFDDDGWNFTKDELYDNFIQKFKDAMKAGDKEITEPINKEITEPIKESKNVVETKNMLHDWPNCTIEQDTIPGLLVKDFAPATTWYQNDYYVYLKIKITDPKKFFIRYTMNTLFFSVLQEKFYYFYFELFGGINPEEFYCFKTGFYISIKMKKLLTEVAWPRLLRSKDRVSWLKLDADHLEVEKNTKKHKQQPYQLTNEFTVIENTDSSDEEDNTDDEHIYNIE